MVNSTDESGFTEGALCEFTTPLISCSNSIEMNQIQGQNVAVISPVLTWPFLLVLFYRLSILAIAVDVFQAWLMLTNHVSELLCPWSTHPWEHFCKNLAFHLRILPRTHPIPQKGFFRSYDHELFSQGKRNGSHPSWHCTKCRDTVLSSTKLTWVYYLKNVMQHHCKVTFFFTHPLKLAYWCQ